MREELDALRRLRGKGKHSINYSQVIDWLVRNPGAFERYLYREFYSQRVGLVVPTHYAARCLPDTHTRRI